MEQMKISLLGDLSLSFHMNAHYRQDSGIFGLAGFSSKDRRTSFVSGFHSEEYRIFDGDFDGVNQTCRNEEMRYPKTR